MAIQDSPGPVGPEIPADHPGPGPADAAGFLGDTHRGLMSEMARKMAPVSSIRLRDMASWGVGRFVVISERNNGQPVYTSGDSYRRNSRG